MCGINLAMNFSESGKTAIQQMMKATAHRGPDLSAWCKINDQLFVAGNRLKTVDLGDWSNQPVQIDDGAFTLVWNGAIYNSDDLRNQLLQGGVAFESRSDSEVLLQWLKTHGASGVKALQGMYALVFVHRESKEVIIARDPHGKKPLYYFHHNNRWLLSSEARGILASGLTPKRLGSGQLVPYFYSRHSFPDKSFFQQVQQILPGKVLQLDFEGNITGEFQTEIPSHHQKLPDKEDFRSLLTDAVLKHFQADVPVGVLLSGGADSSLLLQCWAQETDIPLPTFTVSFEQKYLKKYPDPVYARKVAEKYRCAHHEVLVTPKLLLQHLPEYIASLDQPIGDSASFLSWMIAKEAKKHVRILISGAGADELFSGYNRHEAFKHYLQHKALVLNAAKSIGNFPFLGRRFKKLAKGIREDESTTFLNFSSLGTIPEEHLSAFAAYYPSGLTPYKAALEWDRSYYLVNDVLKIHDNALMAHGVEGRAPYLDEALVSLSKSLSEEQHLALKPKEWIKALLADGGQGKVASRKKTGFGLPLREWLEEDKELQSLVFETIKTFAQEHQHTISEEMLTLALQPGKHLKHHFLEIWNLYILAAWCTYHQL
ncbi:asparagine synthase (glutamine-hydrolyzing) [Echinicola strongylocentroti]|uniref:asparagine synthase (glutamine-hydrolyzing) n=1 Tax=Echinicola strongylocentroti TaxID=1795355 RepID=A0A2Z4IIZ9_9BACT|nr:asparagine synthase (glutamine-hydrolyzing) [Echinicola strongylocentroti]AWW30875.1 asparagine synthase (glutamine-hydrolyzing) [Echinicola strongylocentroti]